MLFKRSLPGKGRRKRREDKDPCYKDLKSRPGVDIPAQKLVQKLRHSHLLTFKPHLSNKLLFDLGQLPHLDLQFFIICDKMVIIILPSHRVAGRVK